MSVEVCPVPALVDDVVEIANNDFGCGKAKPNLIVLWKCSKGITEIAEDEW